MVMEVAYGAYVYQALEFKVGSNLPPNDLIGSTTKEKKGVWVRGVTYAPSLHVRKFNKLEERKGYLSHTIVDDADGDLALYGKCPELVRVDNCTAWRPMSSVLPNIPRVVHPDDIKTRMIHVAGRALHFVCGEPLRVVLPKAIKGCSKQRVRKDELETSHDIDGPKGAGYGVQLTWDVS